MRQSIDINNHLLCFDHTAGHSECIPVWQRYKKNSALEEQINKAIIKRDPNAKSNIVQGKTDSQWNVLYQNNKKKLTCQIMAGNHDQEQKILGYGS